MHDQFLSCLIISKRFGYAFLGSPKCGNTQVKVMLWQAEHEAGNCPPLSGPMTVHVRQSAEDSPWFTLGNCRQLEQALAERSGALFTVLRDPRSRAIAAYLGVIERPYNETYMPLLGFSPDRSLTFAEYLGAVDAQPDAARDPHWMSLHHLLLWSEMSYDFVLRTETLDHDFGALLPKLIPGAQSKFQDPLGAASAERKQLVRHTAKTERLLSTIYRRDFEMLSSV